MHRGANTLLSALAGLLIGVTAVLCARQVLGGGHEVIDEAMHGRFTWRMLAVLAGLKILATLLSFVSGTPGGMFALRCLSAQRLGQRSVALHTYFYRI